MPQQTDAQYVRRVGSSISGGAGQAAAGQECLDSLKGRQLHLRCTARRSSGRLPVEEEIGLAMVKLMPREAEPALKDLTLYAKAFAAALAAVTVLVALGGL